MRIALSCQVLAFRWDCYKYTAFVSPIEVIGLYIDIIVLLMYNIFDTYLYFRSFRERNVMHLRVFVCLLFTALLGGCSAVSSRVSLATNIPLIRTEGTIVRVVNSTGDTLRVRADGHPEFALPPGEEVPVLFYGPDYSAHSWGSSATIVVLGASGAATRSVSVASSGVSSEAWIVGHDDLR
jgi:hypothetical protein